MKLMVNEKNVAYAFSSWDQLQKNVVATKNEMLQISQNLAIEGSNKRVLQQNLRTIGADMERLIEKLAAMENGLDIALSLYENCEKRVLEGSNDVKMLSSAEYVASISDNVKKWWEELVENFQEWKKGREEKKAQEKADNAMAKEIKELLKSDRYSKQTWKKASVEERKEILRELLGELNGIYGINVSDISFMEIESEPGFTTYGYIQYDKGNLAMTINIKLLESDDYYNRVMNTMAHEMRHGYQYSVIDNPQNYEVSDTVIEEWKNNFNDYKTIETDGDDAYFDQPVERDARKFADRVIRE